MSHYNDDKTGCVPHPGNMVCRECNEDITPKRGGFRRILCRDRHGQLREYAASEVLSWPEGAVGQAQWDSLTWKRSGLEFVRWVQKHNECHDWEAA